MLSIIISDGQITISTTKIVCTKYPKICFNLSHYAFFNFSIYFASFVYLSPVASFLFLSKLFSLLPLFLLFFLKYRYKLLFSIAIYIALLKIHKTKSIVGPFFFKLFSIFISFSLSL